MLVFLVLASSRGRGLVLSPEPQRVGQFADPARHRAQAGAGGVREARGSSGEARDGDKEDEISDPRSRGLHRHAARTHHGANPHAAAGPHQDEMMQQTLHYPSINPGWTSQPCTATATI